MSVENLLFFNGDKLPTVSEWQAALNAAGVDIRLDDVGDLRSHTGYLLAAFEGHESGFEWYFTANDEIFPDGVPEWVGGRSHSANFRTFSDFRELVCAMTAGSVLGQLTDGVGWEGVSPESWLREAMEARDLIK